MEHTPNDDGLKIGARVEAEIRERIKFLERRIEAYRKHGKKTGLDETEREKLQEFLRSLGLTLAVALPMAAALFVMSPMAHARDAAECGPYMSARGCLDAIRVYTAQCVAVKFGGHATDAQLIQCVQAALVRTGALDIGDPAPEEGR
jgi:hypothetical protein